MENYIPLLKLHPEKHSRPVCDYDISVWLFHSPYDNVEAINLNEKKVQILFYR